MMSAVALLASCATLGPQAQETANQNGRVPASDPQQDSLRAIFASHAVHITWKDRTLCSGLLIRPGQILTAARCLKSLQNQTQAIVDQNLDLRVEGRSLKTAALKIFYSRDYDLAESDPKKTLGDLAVILIGAQSKKPLNYAITNFNESQTEIYATVGYRPEPAPPEPKRKAASVPATVPAPAPKPWVLNVAELGYAAAAEQHEVAADLAFMNGSVPQGMICDGDLGAPVFRMKADRPQLIGVVSGTIYQGDAQTPPPPHLKRKDQVRFVCKSEIGLANFTAVRSYQRFIDDPVQYGIPLALKTK